MSFLSSDGSNSSSSSGIISDIGSSSDSNLSASSDFSRSSDESQPLLSQAREDHSVVLGNQNISIARQRAMLATIIGLQFFTSCFNTCAYPFYPEVATNKGLTSTEIGVVYSSYDIARVITSPIAGALVRNSNMQ